MIDPVAHHFDARTRSRFYCTAIVAVFDAEPPIKMINGAARPAAAFSELSPEELRGLEAALKKAGKRAAALMEAS
jgi:hypothetical protein